MKGLTDLLLRELKNLVRGDGKEKDQIIRNDTITGIEKMFRNGQIPSVISYLKYEPNEVQGATRHRDVDSTYCTSLVFQRDTYNVVKSGQR